jgi:hypothetical protein
MTWPLYQSSPPDSYSQSEVTTTKTINYGNGTQCHSSRQSHMSHIALCWGDRSDPFNPCPRLISPTTFIAPVSPHHPLRFSLRLVRLFLSPRYATVYTALHPDVIAQIHVLVLFQIQDPRTQCFMPSMASMLRPLKTRKR